MSPRTPAEVVSSLSRSHAPQGLPITILDSDDTRQADLRGGGSPWFAASGLAGRPACSEDLSCDALIVGGGITGSLVAERLTRQGLDVVIIDR